METFIWILHIIVAATLVGLVLLQHGKGADMGAAFGSGASGSLFGSSGSANFLSRATAIAATVFFMTSVGLTYFSLNKTTHAGSVLEKVKAPVQTPMANPATQPASGNQPGTGSGEIPK